MPNRGESTLPAPCRQARAVHERDPMQDIHLSPPVRRALWFIEGHLRDDVCLDDIARSSGVSRFHLSRTFVAVTGVPVMQYLRSRRLSEAARDLAGGAPDILSVALDWGYGSHEAFTRAFSSEFGLTPERLRAGGSLDTLPLTELLIMQPANLVQVTPPREARCRAMTVAGLGERYNVATNQGIPALWDRFVQRLGHIPQQTGSETFGVCRHSDREGNFEYIAGVEVSGTRDLPADFTKVDIEAGRYAVFTHRGHIAGIRDTVYSIWNHGLAESGYEPAGTPDFERYTDAFDPTTGTGEVEIWIPVR